MPANTRSFTFPLTLVKAVWIQPCWVEFTRNTKVCNKSAQSPTSIGFDRISRPFRTRPTIPSYQKWQNPSISASVNLQFCKNPRGLMVRPFFCGPADVFTNPLLILLVIAPQPISRAQLNRISRLGFFQNYRPVDYY